MNSIAQLRKRVNIHQRDQVFDQICSQISHQVRVYVFDHVSDQMCVWLTLSLKEKLYE